jgi:hypothetical protein
MVYASFLLFHESRAAFLVPLLQHKLKQIGRQATGKVILLSRAPETFGPHYCQDLDPDRIEALQSFNSAIL